MPLHLIKPITAYAQSISNESFINSCTNITAPGYYILNNSIQGIQGKGYCIGIFSNNVILNGQENSLSMSFVNGTGIYISPISHNIIIENMSLSDFNIGISANGHNITIENIKGLFDGVVISINNSKINVENAFLLDNFIYGINATGNNILINNSNIIDSGSGLYINGSNVRLDYIKLTNGGVYLTPNSKNFSINSVSVNDRPLVYLNYTSNVLISNAGEVIAFNSRNLYIKKF
ncbi:hypothetical protein [Caldisphaera sp.]|uniref:hypothetical protein n=1 Tax=Caldisphaera sp. TaxID=2060322 RepID=UPI003D0B546C